MIRRLVDQAFNSGKYYISAVGLSTDVKPTEGIITGSKFVAVDTGAGYLFDETSGEWHENTQLSEAVAAYLDEHPEAVTTVTDGSITKAKLDSNLQATVDDVGVLKSAITNIRTDIGAPFVSFTPIDGKYIFYNTEKSSNALSRSGPIAVSKGDIVEFTATGYSNSVAMIATCNAEGTTFTDAVRCTDGNNEHTYTYTATTDGYIVVSYDHRQPYSLVIKGKSSNVILNDRVTSLEASNPLATAEAVGLNILVDRAEMSITVGNFVNAGGEVRPSSNFGMSNPVSLNEGDTIAFNAMGYLQSVAILAKVSNGVYTPLIISADSDEHDFSYTADTAMSVVVSTNKNVVPDYTVYNSTISNIETELKNIENDFFAFATMGVIGDSLASGASNYTGGAADRPLYSWGKYIERNHGVQTSLFSFGGATTRTWLSNNRGKTALLNGDILDCYIIGLGVNDAYSLGASYLGSISDVNVGNEENNADTYFGNYSRIIAAIKQKSPRAKIFCLTNPKTNGVNVPEFNNAIADIVALYSNAYLIDLTTDSFYRSVLFDETWNTAHSTAVGYKLIAENLYGHIKSIIKSNVSEFTDIQWIIEDHE